MKKILRTGALALLLTIILSALASCGARPLAQTKLSKTEVGTVGEYSVPYEEFYFLATSYLATAKEKYKNDTAAIKEYVWEHINENIITNYAILTLCASEGLNYSERELRKEVNAHIESVIESSFDGNREDYFASQQEAGITDHYYRFSTGVDILYNKLGQKYQTDGIIPNTDEKIKETIKKDFIHTWHIAIFVSEGDDRATEYAKAEEALRLLESGNSMYQLIGSKYNENTVPESLKNAYGYYFPKGVMEKGYEDAAFALEKSGDRSGIIVSQGTDTNGELCECFYIIERLPIKDSEIEDNFDSLSDMLKDAIIVQKLEDTKKDLSFKPNDYALSLDVTSLEEPKNGADIQLIATITISVVSLIAIVVIIFVFRTVRAKRFHKKHKKSF